MFRPVLSRAAATNVRWQVPSVQLSSWWSGSDDSKPKDQAEGMSEEMRKMQAQLPSDPNKMMEMMNSPQAKALLENPAQLKSMMESNPMLRTMLATNPQVKQMLDNPEMLKSALDAMKSNPEMMKNAMQQAGIKTPEAPSAPEPVIPSATFAQRPKKKKLPKE
jgi:ubiquilin